MVDRLQEPDDAPARRRRQVFVAVWAVVFVLVVVVFRDVLRPFVLGALLAYVLHPVARAMCNVRVAGRALPRWFAVVTLYVGLVATLATTITLMTPRVITEVRAFAANDLPAIRRRADATWLPAVRRQVERVQGLLQAGSAVAADDDEEPDEGALRIEKVTDGSWRVSLPGDGIEVAPDDDGHYRVTTARARRTHERSELSRRIRALGAGHVADIVRVGGGIIGGLIGGVFGFFMTMMVSAYMLVTEDQILAFARGLIQPTLRPAWEALLARLDRGLKGVVRGQLIICLVNGALSAVGFALADLKYWPTLALIATVMSLIPIFGSILSSVPAVAVGLTQSFGTGMFVLVWILGIHQLEANLLNPKIMGDAAKIHPVLVVFSLLAGEHFFGILGALLAVPAMSVAQSVFLHWRGYALAWGDDDAGQGAG
jgi:predicted PurR-regulated permease PerM